MTPRKSTSTEKTTKTAKKKADVAKSDTKPIVDATDNAAPADSEQPAAPITAPATSETPIVENPQVAEESTSEQKLCECKKKCGRPAPEFGPYNEECFAEHQLSLGKVECQNFEVCKHWVKPFLKDGVAVPSYCESCRSAHKRGEKVVADKKQMSKDERVNNQRSFAHNLLETLGNKFPQVDLAPAKELISEADIEFAIGKFDDANTSYNAAIAKANFAVAMHVAHESIPAVMAEIENCVRDNPTVPELVFADLIRVAGGNSDEFGIQEDLHKEDAKTANFQMQNRLRNLQDILTEMKDRVDRFTRPLEPVRKKSKQERRDQGEERRAAHNGWRHNG